LLSQYFQQELGKKGVRIVLLGNHFANDVKSTVELRNNLMLAGSEAHWDTICQASKESS
jgi:hypothetical protein